jgi:SRSO17 transposase
VGVFACLGRGGDLALVDLALYLPAEWAKDAERCDRAKIPEGEREYRAKWELALDMVRRARAGGVRFGWVGADSLYGHNNLFLNALEDDGENFVADVRKDFMVWTEEPATSVPPRKPGSRGAGPTVPRLDDPAQKARAHTRVDALTSEHFEAGAEVLKYRAGTKGELCAKFWSTGVWVWDANRNGPPPRRRTLIVRQDASGDFKYTLTNLPPAEGRAALGELAHKQGERFWIEHAFHEAKSQLGMAQYQVRVWRGWHHHMALVALALLFTTLEKIRTRGAHPLLSCRDITELLDHYLPRRGRREDDVLAQIAKRHATRQRDIDRRRKHRTGIPPDEV